MFGLEGRQQGDFSRKKSWLSYLLEINHIWVSYNKIGKEKVLVFQNRDFKNRGMYKSGHNIYMNIFLINDTE